MSDREARTAGWRARTDRRRLLGTGGMLAGAASLLGGAPAVGAVAGGSVSNTQWRSAMQTLRPDPTFYPSPRSAMRAPAELLAYVVRVNPTGDARPDAICVVDVDPTRAPTARSSARSR